MEKALSINVERPVAKNILLGAVLVSMAFSMILIAYGPETIMTMAHDTFHDFRHTIGMPCH